MEFDEHEEQEEETGIQVQANYDTAVAGNSGRPKMGGGGEAAALRRGGQVRYRECKKNHAVSIGGHAVDGCGEFMPAGDDGTLDTLICAACNCHRSFHRKEEEGEAFHRHHHHHQQQQQQLSPYYRTANPAGYLHVAPPPHQRPLALPSAEREEEDMSNPSSSGGGSGSKKRFRTKFTQDQKDKMLEFAERLGWRIQKQDEAAVEQFCAETGVKRNVLKVWMHNNKHTLGKKP
ncbi:Zinc-finger homeodomain protein [Actinidia chinensis var. chinensis]|uniref:Zinc-finger homeodomain protein n=1 Tax=Actinidia chinensis var. chinensis TaxID=1590841 RepID=A0A2R6Q097_ACTCC|nr:Zinc-finger homeodomain protein [Actinidia chinensis var. chinensis]